MLVNLANSHALILKQSPALLRFDKSRSCDDNDISDVGEDEDEGGEEGW